MNVAFVSNGDPFSDSGGAEQNSLGLIEALTSKFECQITFIKSSLININDIIKYDVFILEDFWGISEDVCNALLQEKYVIFENSYGFSTDKFLGINKRNLPWIENNIQYREVYEKAHSVFLQSWFQHTIFQCNLPELKNLVCLDGNFWTMDCLSLLKKYSSVRNWGEDIFPNHNNRYVIIDGKNDLHRKVKGVEESIALCQEKDLKYDVMSFSGYEDYLKNLANSSGLVFTPTVPETFSRVYIEALYLGLDVITNDNLGAKRSRWASDFIPNFMLRYNNLASRKIWKALSQ